MKISKNYTKIHIAPKTLEELYRQRLTIADTPHQILLRLFKTSTFTEVHTYRRHSSKKSIALTERITISLDTCAMLREMKQKYDIKSYDEAIWRLIENDKRT